MTDENKNTKVAPTGVPLSEDKGEEKKEDAVKTEDTEKKEVVEVPKEEVKVETKTDVAEKKIEAKEDVKIETEKESASKKEEAKPKKKAEKKAAKEFVVANLSNLKMSTKYAISICKFIKHKTVEQAILDLEQVKLKKKAVPMKGEIPHRHGKGMMSGRFPERAAEEFVSALKSTLSNAASHGIEDPVIVEAIANIGNRPYARYGIRRKRTHLKIKLKNKAEKKKTVNKKE